MEDIEEKRAEQRFYVIDDDTAIARLVAVNLAARGYCIKQFHYLNNPQFSRHLSEQD